MDEGRDFIKDLYRYTFLLCIIYERNLNVSLEIVHFILSRVISHTGFISPWNA